MSKKVIKRRSTGRRIRKIKFSLPKDAELDYKNINVLQKLTTERGKILSRRLTGISAKNQRAVVTAIKRARFLGLLTGGGNRKT